MNKIVLILTLIFVSTVSIHSQALAWDQNRIAVSADGNNQPDNMHKWTKGDPDDWGGTPTALAILAKLKLQDKLVHYSYNNFIAAPPHTTATNEMKLGVDGGIKFWNFDASRFFDVSANNQIALDHLAAELAKSTAEDPLYFIHMGPSEFFYRAVKQVVDGGDEAALAFVYVISHSGYNDNHLRRGDPKFDIEPVAEADKHHTMTETIALSGDRLQYKKIKDQNSGDDPNAGWKSDTDWSVWYWMRDHKDPSVQWIYERMLANAKNSADVSDAGMLYYLLLDDEDGSPSKFQAFIGEGINEVSDTPVCQDLTWIGIQDFEMEKIDTFVMPYKDNGRNAIAINAGTYKNKFAASQKEFDGVSGFYNITLTSLTEEDGESTYRVSVNGELVGEGQNPETTDDMAEHTFTFEKVYVPSGALIQIESNTHSNGKIPEGDAYAFARGRWRSIAFECTEGQCDVQDVDGLLVFEAERMELQGDWKLGKDDAKASGGEYIYFDGANKYSEVSMNDVVSYTFKVAEPGNYTVKWMMRQPEGERGTDKGNDVWIYFSDDIGYASNTQITQYEKFYSRSGDDFILHGVAEVHGVGHSWLTAKFPTAGEYTINIGGRSHGLQIDRIVMFKGWTMDEVELKLKEIMETSTCGNMMNTSVEKVAVAAFPTKVPNKQRAIEVQVNYTAFEAREIHCTLLKPDATVVSTLVSEVAEGVGLTTFKFDLAEELAVASDYMLKVELRPVGATPEQSLYTKELSFSVVDGDAPAASDEVSFLNPLTVLSKDATSISVKVSYSASEERDVVLALYDTEDKFVTNTKVEVSAGTNELSINLPLTSTLAVADKYKLMIAIRTRGGDWQTNFDRQDIFFNVTNTAALRANDLVSVQVYPNPCHGFMTFENDGTVEMAKLYSVSGQLLLSHRARPLHNLISTDLISSGIYFLKFDHTDGASHITKIVKE